MRNPQQASTLNVLGDRQSPSDGITPRATGGIPEIIENTSEKSLDLTFEEKKQDAMAKK